MKSSGCKLFASLTVPLLIIALTGYFTAVKLTASGELHTGLKNLSYVLFLTGMALSCFFNRSRVFFVLLVLAVNELGLSVFVPAGPDKNLYLELIYPVACFLVPLNILVFSFLKERGILNAYGRKRLSFLLIQLIFTSWIFWAEDRHLVNLLKVKVSAQSFFNLTPVPQIPIFMFIIAFLILLIRLVLSKSALEGSFAGVLTAAAIALHFGGGSPASACFFSASGLIMIIAVIQDSHSKAYIDELTGLPTRRSLKEEMMKLGGKYVIAMLDIDFFKSINDKYGHDVGDQVLKFLAAMIKTVSGNGKPFRYGGEEFAIIFPGRDIDDAVPHLEELRAKISRRGFILRGKDRTRKKPRKGSPGKRPVRKISVTVSIGVSENNGQNKTAEEVIQAADIALYTAKESGRNCISIS